MKAGINQWAFPSDMPVDECISLAKRHGFEAFEVCVGEEGPLRLDASESDVEDIRKYAENEGIALYSVGSGDGWRYPLTSNKPEVREQGKANLKKALQICNWLNAEALLVVPGVVDEETPYDQALENALESIRELVPVAESLEVSIALENVWNKFLLSPTEMRDFIDQCDSKYVGAYVDVGNMLPYGYPEQWIRILGHRVHAIHMKDFRRSVGNINGFVMLMEGDVNWPGVIAALRDIGYDRGLVAEYGGYGHSLDTMLTHVHASLKTIMSL